MDNLQSTVEEKLQELPPEVQEFLLNTSWIDSIQVVLTKHSINSEQASQIEDEVMLYLLMSQDKAELSQNIKEILLGLPVAISDIITNELIETVPQNIQAINQKIFAVSEPNATPQETGEIPDNLPTEEETESSVGVDIIPEEETEEEETTLGKNSLIQSIEHPEQVEKIEQQAEVSPKPSFNPVSSKLGGSTQPQQNTDPYREPLN